jgi:hypothetical protein
MGFLSKAFKKVKKQIQPGQMPRRGGGFGNLGGYSQIKRTTRRRYGYAKNAKYARYGFSRRNSWILR